MNRFAFVRNLLLSFLFVLAAASLASPQTGTSSLRGVVTDKSKSVIVDATVTLTNLGQAQERKAQTNATGEYEFVLLPPGKYSIAVDSEGRSVRVTLNRRGHSLRIEGITQRQNQGHGGNVLVVERDGAAHQLASIQVAQLDLVFSSTSSFERPADGKPRSLQELPLILADSER